MKSKHGVYYDLSISEYKTTAAGVTYHFSSKNHKEKFDECLTGNRQRVAELLTARFKVAVTANPMADIYLYSRIETRGFYINIEGAGVARCADSLKLHGQRISIANCLPTSESLTPK